MKKEKPKKVDYKAEYEELRDLLQRTQADFVNYRRRNEESRTEFAKFATSDMISQIIPVMDNFALAAKHVPKELEGNGWVIGIQAVEKQLEQILSANGVERVESLGQEFDPSKHEALSETHVEGKKDNEIVSEEMPGYLLNGKLIRPSKVIVNKKN